MIKLAATLLLLAGVSLASEPAAEYNDYNEARPGYDGRYQGHYYPYYGYYPFHMYHPAPFYYYPGPYYYPYSYEHHYQPAPHYGGLVFVGKFEGTCHGASNGIYYVDDRSFAYCSNGIKTIQSCADGSANAPYAKFEKGRYYQFSEFCSVNLVAQQKVPGYATHPHRPAEVKQDKKSHVY